MVVYILLTVKQNNICGFIWVIRVCPTTEITGVRPTNSFETDPSKLRTPVHHHVGPLYVIRDIMFFILF